MQKIAYPKQPMHRISYTKLTEAQIASAELGVRRFEELLATYGKDTVIQATRQLMDYTEAMLRREIGKIPDGDYVAEGFLDDDGRNRGVTLPLPEAPLLAVLAKQARDVFQFDRALDGPPRLPADGFYQADHDILVLSPERLDTVGWLVLPSLIDDGLIEKTSRPKLRLRSPFDETSADATVWTETTTERCTTCSATTRVSSSFWRASSSWTTCSSCTSAGTIS